MDWNEYFLKLAEDASLKSKDDSTKVGCVIVDEDNNTRCSGFNGFPRGIREERIGSHKELDPIRWARPTKYDYVEHAERNAIYTAARAGNALKGCTLYLNFQPVPCTGCARAIIQSGITRVIGNTTPFPGKGEQWEADLKRAHEMLQEAGVEMLIYNSESGMLSPYRR